MMKKRQKSKKPLFKSKQKFLVFIILIQLLLLTQSFNTGEAALTYNENTSLTFEMKYKIQLQNLSPTASNIQMWVNRYNNWSSLQTSYLTHFDVNKEPEDYNFTPFDVHNNTYDYFQKSLELNQKIIIDYTYQITLNSSKWEIPNNLKIEDYDKNSDLYKQYTQETLYFEVNDPNIQGNASDITQGLEYVSEIIESVYFFVVKNMEYEIQTQAWPKTALKALGDMVGDCSEFSSLMVTLLRAAGIPARKVLGIGLVDGDASSPNLLRDLKVGDQWSYNRDNLPAHAWVEYYVPTLGWISADPTWGNSLYNSPNIPESRREEYANDYLHQIDNLHLISTNGDWYQEGIEPELIIPNSKYEGLAEFPLIYPIYSGSLPQASFSYSFEVLNFIQERETTLMPQILAFSLGGGLFLLIMIFYGYLHRKEKNNEHN